MLSILVFQQILSFAVSSHSSLSLSVSSEIIGMFKTSEKMFVFSSSSSWLSDSESKPLTVLSQSESIPLSHMYFRIYFSLRYFLDVLKLTGQRITRAVVTWCNHQKSGYCSEIGLIVSLQFCLILKKSIILNYFT